MVKDEKAWRRTPKGDAEYRRVVAEARELANRDGYDRGVEANDLFQTFRHFMLPQKRHRTGHELRCEVVCADDVSRSKPGHGVCA